MPVWSKLAPSLRSLSRLGRRSPREQLLVVEAAAHLVAAKAMLKLLPFEHWRSQLAREPVQGSAVLPSAPRLSELAWAVNGVGARFPERLNCLPRALATRWMMQRRGWSSSLEIGVARDAQGNLEAHAWIEHEGQVVIGLVPNLERFQKLPEVAAQHLR
ncbi:MAG: lasso peptide biosynthesis B2 protein [Myxococcales bacterium]